MITGIIEATPNCLMPVTQEKALIDNLLVGMSLAGAKHVFVLCHPTQAGELAWRFDSVAYKNLGIYPKLMPLQEYTPDFIESLREDFTFFAYANKWVSPAAFMDGMDLTDDSRDSTVYIGSKANVLWYTYIFPRRAKFTINPDIYKTYELSFAWSVTNIATYLQLVERENREIRKVGI